MFRQRQYRSWFVVAVLLVVSGLFEPSWGQCNQTILNDPNFDPTDSFGRGVAVADNYVFIADGFKRNARYYTTSGGFSNPEEPPEATSQFGQSVAAIDHPTLGPVCWVGDPGKGGTGDVLLGHRLLPPNPPIFFWDWEDDFIPNVFNSTDAQLGASIAVAPGNWVLKGAPGVDIHGTDAGDAFIENVSLADVLGAGPSAGARFGEYVAVVNNVGEDPRAAVAAPGEHKVYFFKRSGGTWVEDGAPLSGGNLFPTPWDRIQHIAISGTFNEQLLTVEVIDEPLIDGPHYMVRVFKRDAASSLEWTHVEDLIDHARPALDGNRGVFLTPTIFGFGGNPVIRDWNGSNWIEKLRLSNGGDFSNLDDTDIKGERVVFSKLPITFFPTFGTVVVSDVPLHDCNNNCIDDDTEVGPDCNGDQILDACQSDTWAATSGLFHDDANWQNGAVPTAVAQVAGASAGPSVCSVNQNVSVCEVQVQGSPLGTQTLSLQSGVIVDAGVIGVDALGRAEGEGTIGSASSNVTNLGTMTSIGSDLTVRGASVHNQRSGSDAGLMAALAGPLTIDAVSFVQEGVLSTNGHTLTVTPHLTNAVGGKVKVQAPPSLLLAPNGLTNHEAGTQIDPGVDLKGGTVSLGGSSLTNHGLVVAYGNIQSTLVKPSFAVTNHSVIYVTDLISTSFVGLNVTGSIENHGMIHVASGDNLVVIGCLTNVGSGSALSGVTCIPGPCRSTGEESGFGTVQVAGDISFDAPSTLDAENGLLVVEGNFSSSIDDPSRFSMSEATLFFNGLSFFGTQELTLSSSDQGVSYPPSAPPDYAFGTVRVGASAAVKLVDPEGNRVLYVRDLILDPAASLDIAGKTVYYDTIQGDPGTQITDSVGGGQLLPVDTVTDVVPVAAFRTQLHPAYPNPFRSQTTLSFDLGSPSSADLRFFDLHGRAIRTIEASQLGVGSHSLRWDGRDNSGTHVAPGIYFYKLRAGGREQTGRLVFVR